MSVWCWHAACYEGQLLGEAGRKENLTLSRSKEVMKMEKVATLPKNPRSAVAIEFSGRASLCEIKTASPPALNRLSRSV